MTEYDNRNSGALFKNEPAPGKELSEKAPYYKGPATGPNNEPLEIAAWLRKTKEGKPFLSVKWGPKWVPPEGQQRPEPRTVEPVLDDDIPF